MARAAPATDRAMKRAFFSLAIATIASAACGDDHVVRPRPDGGARDAAVSADAGAAPDTGADAGGARDASTIDSSLTDSGIVDTGMPCDPAAYFNACDADPSRILRCLGSGPSTVHAVPCGAARACFTGPSGGAECSDTDLGLCDPEHVPSCSDEHTRVTCMLFAGPEGFVDGVKSRERCPATEVCTMLATGAVCAPDGAEECDAAEYEPSCHDDHLYYACEGGIVRARNPCGDPYRCVRTAGSLFSCVDATLTMCDPDTAAPRCERAPESAVTCDATGYVVHAPCGTTNPLCVVIGDSAGCSYPGAPACPPSGATRCDSTAEHVEGCTTEGIPVRKRCIVSPAAPTCACRPSTTGLPSDCYTEGGVPCASTDA